MKRLLVLACAGVLVVLTVDPLAAAADREQQQIIADIRMLQEETLRLQLVLGTLGQTLETVMAKLDEQGGSTRKAFADQKLLVDNVADDVRILREKVDDTNVRISSLSQELEALRISIPPMAPAMTTLLVDPDTGEPFEPVGPPTPIVPVSPGVSPQRMYDTAWADYTTGQWALAIQGFEAYIKTFPKSELTDDAQFYIGQTYYADGRFDEAVAAFGQVLAAYPDGDVVPEATYKRGLSLDRLGDTERARTSFELIIENYPESPMAPLAQQALDRLTRAER
jgi:tol-pal system protein YbgF